MFDLQIGKYNELASNFLLFKKYDLVSVFLTLILLYDFACACYFLGMCLVCAWYVHGMCLVCAWYLLVYAWCTKMNKKLTMTENV